MLLPDFETQMREAWVWAGRDEQVFDLYFSERDAEIRESVEAECDFEHCEDGKCIDPRDSFDVESAFWDNLTESRRKEIYEALKEEFVNDEE